MTEDLNLNEIIEKLRLEIDSKVTNNVRENVFLTNAINDLLDKIKDELELKLKEMIEKLDSKYLSILLNEIKENIIKEEKDEKEEEELAMNLKDTEISYDKEEIKTNKFDKYDDMTLFNKVILSLNTKEEKLSRKESKLEKRKEEVEERLTITNKNIEKNIERENKLSQRKLELNANEVELNSKLSEAEVIFLNIKPLIKGLNKIKVEEQKGGVGNE